MEPNPMLAEELQNLDLDSDSSFTSQELAHFDIKLLELAFEKDQAKKNRSSISFHLTSWWACENQTETNIKMEKTNMISKIQNEAEGSTILYSKPNGNFDFKKAQLDTLGLSENTIKRKRRQLKETGLIKRQPESGRKMIIDEEKECFILEHLAGNPFLSATKIATLLKALFKDLEISEISIRRFLVQKGYKWKGPL